MINITVGQLIQDKAQYFETVTEADGSSCEFVKKGVILNTRDGLNIEAAYINQRGKSELMVTDSEGVSHCVEYGLNYRVRCSKCIEE